jgi:2-polyprenyl-3-methyl-5-hydroxy-6-metoxy-1,4-benzoquinol methylase
MMMKQGLIRDYQAKERLYFESERPEMLRFIPAEVSKVLEVGCGNGNFARLIKAQFAAQVWGVELDREAALIAEQQLDKVIWGEFSETLDLPKHSFDCIIFNDVLEHLVDPEQALLDCKALLQEGGVIVASIPNVRYFYNVINLAIYGEWNYTDKGILDRTHLRFFTYRSILETFERLGYEIETIEGVNPIKNLCLPGKLRYLNGLLPLFANRIEDMRYLQFAVVAKPKSN